MIVEERLVTYINSLDSGNTPLLEEIEVEAKKNYVPVIRKEMQSFLKSMLALKRPERILEVGTAVGFSALLMEEYNPVPCRITNHRKLREKNSYCTGKFQTCRKRERNHTDSGRCHRGVKDVRRFL